MDGDNNKSDRKQTAVMGGAVWVTTIVKKGVGTAALSDMNDATTACRLRTDSRRAACHLLQAAAGGAHKDAELRHIVGRALCCVWWWCGTQIQQQRG